MKLSTELNPFSASIFMLYFCYRNN
jgi:hypothetical protein